MADFNASVALGINPPDPQGGLNTLSKIMGLGQQGLAIRGQQSENVTRAAQATEAKQNATEKMAGAQLLSDPVGNGLVDETGAPTPNAQKIIMQAMPTTGSQHYEGLLKGATAKVQFNSAANDLRTSERAEAANTVAGIATRAESANEVTDGLDAWLDSKKGLPEYSNYQTIAGTMKTAINHLATKTAGNNPVEAGQEPWRKGALNMAASLLPAASTVGPQGLRTPQAGVQNLGGTNQPIVQAPALAGGAVTTAPGATTNTTPPGYTLGPNGQLLRVAPGATSATVIPTTAGPAVPPPTAKLQPLARPGANAPRADQENYNARIKQAGDEQQAVAQAANDPLNGVQSTRFRNQQILDLIPHADTGPGLKLLNTVASRLPGASGDAYQDLEHYTAQNSAALAKLMGVPGTNLGAETAAAAAGNVERNPGALKEITKTNDALNTAFDLYNRGMAKVTNNGSDLSRAAAYKQAFGQNMDVNAIRWADAHRRKDQEEIAALQAKAGPQGVAEYGRKLSTLKSLATAGDLP